MASFWISFNAIPSQDCISGKNSAYYLHSFAVVQV